MQPYTIRVSLTVICLLFLGPGATHGQRHDYYSSISKLENLLQIQRDVKDMMRHYTARLQKSIDIINEYLSDVSHSPSAEESTKYVSHPLHAYHLAKQLTFDLSTVEMHIQELRRFDPLLNITILRQGRYLPWEEDFHGMAGSLVRLQDTYKLNLTQLSNGVLEGHGFPQPIHGVLGLSARDYLFIGKVAFNLGYYDRAIEWLEEALKKSPVEEPQTTPKEEILPFYNTAISKHDEVLQYKGKKGPDWQTYEVPFSKRSKRSTDFVATLLKPDLPRVLEAEQFKRLCRGEVLRTPKMDRALRCRYFYGKHPVYQLQPVKVEEANLRPYVTILHDVIHDRDINDLLQFAKPRLLRSTHYSPSGNKEASNVRISANTWLSDRDAPVAERLNTWIQELFGLGTRYNFLEAESYQLANYGIGGQYTSHHDFLQATYMIPNRKLDPFEASSGDRIATLMFYLTDVEAGGATVFPFLGLRLQPKKGSAVFWWNLKADGNGNALTKHGGCPVLHGSKWIANKWFRSYSNMFRIPCQKSSDADIPPLHLI